MAEPALFERRRYSALLVQHREVADMSALRALDPRFTARPKPLKLSVAQGWGAHRCQYTSTSNLYPPSAGDAEARRVGDEYAHDIYCAFKVLPGSRTPTLFIASPYIRLLDRIARELKQRVGVPGIQYLRVNMAAVYSAVSRDLPGIRATRVTLQVESESELELISLTGRNPLNSKIHAALEKDTQPYGLRAEVVTGSRCRINVDRHGNLWWYQASESSFELPLLLIDRMTSWGALQQTRSLPLRRISDEDRPA